MKLIIHAKPDDYILAVRAAKYVQQPGYDFPADGLCILSYGDEFDPGKTFAVKRNKASLSVWGPA